MPCATEMIGGQLDLRGIIANFHSVNIVVEVVTTFLGNIVVGGCYCQSPRGVLEYVIVSRMVEEDLNFGNKLEPHAVAG